MNFPERNLLFIAYLFPPVGAGGLPGSQRAVKLIKYLKGYQVTVLTVKEEDYPDLVELNFLRDLPVKNETIVRTWFRNPFDYLLKLRSLLRGVVGGPVSAGSPPQHPPRATDQPVAGKNPSMLQRFLDYVHALCHFPDPAGAWIVPAVFVGRRLVKKRHIDIVLATGNPWSSLVIAWLLHKLTGVPYIVDFRDPWVGNPFHTSRGRLLDTLERYLERQVVIHALLVLVNTEELRVEMVERYSEATAADKVLVVTNGFDPDDFGPPPALQPPHPEAAAEPLVLAHAGLLYGVRDPAPFLEAISVLEGSGDVPAQAFRFVQMGKVSLQYDFHDRYRELISRGVVQDLGSYPFDECLRQLQGADVLLLIQPGTKSQVPSKLYDYLCLDLPIVTITPLDGALGNLLRENGFGDVFSPDDVAGISARLKQLWEEKAANGSIRVHYQHRDRFNIENIVSALEQNMNLALMQQSETASRCLP